MKSKTVTSTLLILLITLTASAQERVLHFPKDKSLGVLYVMDDAGPGEIKAFHHWIRTGPEWEFFAEATGNVSIPVEKIVKLQICDAHNKDLSVLENLDPNDIHTLFFYRTGFDTRGVKQENFEHIYRLTGLKELNLGAISTTSGALKNLPKLTRLESLGTPKNLTNTGLRYICQIKILKRLDIKENWLTDAGLRHIVNLTDLRELGLGGKKLTDDSLKYLAKLPNLEYLILWGKYTDNCLAHVKKIRSLKIFYPFRIKAITDAGMPHITEMTQLERLSLYDTGITDKGTIHLTKLKNLRMLDVGWTNLTDASIPHITKLQNLEHLFLPYEGITDKGIAQLTTLDKLKYLWVGGSSRSPLTDQALDSISELDILEELHIAGPQFTNDGMKHLVRLNNIKSLMLFSVSRVTDEGLTHLKDLKSLQNLDVTDADVSMSAVSSLNSLANLKRLRISHIRQDGSGLDISNMKFLEELLLSMTSHVHNKKRTYESLTDKDMECAGKLGSLKKFEVETHLVTDAGFAHLSGLKNMENIAVGGPNLTDDCLKYFANMKKLQHLSFNNSNITGKGFKHLDKCESLRMLTIKTRRRIPSSRINQLKENLPLDFVKITPLNADGQPIPPKNNRQGNSNRRQRR